MKKQVLYFHEDRYKDAIKKIDANLNLLTAIKDAYDETGLPALSGNEIQQLILNPTDFLFEKMTNGEPLELGGVKMKKDVAIDLLQKPPGYETLTKLIADLRNVPGYDYAVRKAELIDGEYRLIESADEAQRQAYTIYIENEQQQKICDFVKSVVDKANELWPIGERWRPNSLIELLSGTLHHPVDSEVNKSFRMNMEAVTRAKLL